MSAQTAAVTAPAASAPSPAAAANPQPPAEAVVTVVANRASNQVDRQVYDVKDNPATSNSTAADALNSVPSVVVTPDGQVTLRGNSNVQILIDGKPSAMLQGENRGTALNALPAGDIASIEVINTPGAQFGGGGPVLNLVMQKNRRAGGFAAVTINTGTNGRRNANLNGNYTSGRLSVQGSLYARRDRPDSTFEASRTRIDPLTGIARRSHQASRSTNPNESASLNAGINYNVTDKDKVNANVHLMRSDRTSSALDQYINFGSDDTPDSKYERTVAGNGRTGNAMLSASWEHSGDTRGEEFSSDLRISGTDSANGSLYFIRYLLRPPGGLDARSRQSSATDTRITDLTGDYKNPDVAGGTLKAGYKALRQRNNFDSRYFDADPVTQAETVNSVRTNSFGVDESIFALYGSYEWRFRERWGVLGGLRAEHTRLDVDQVTSNVHADQSYTHFIPSFYVTYEVSKDTDVRLSYANRINRPGAYALNPFVVYRDEFNASAGNPYLKPSKDDTLELALETKVGKLNTNLRAYYSHDSNLIMEDRYFVSDTLLLTTRKNGGSNDSSGLELTLGGKVTSSLNINMSANLAHAEQTMSFGQAGGITRLSTTSLSGHARFHLQASKHDMLQFMLNAQGRSLSGSAYRDPYVNADFTYRRVVTPALSLVLNVRDMFDSNTTRNVTDTSLLKETSIRRSSGRSVFVGLSYRVGGFSSNPARKTASSQNTTDIKDRHAHQAVVLRRHPFAVTDARRRC